MDMRYSLTPAERENCNAHEFEQMYATAGKDLVDFGVDVHEKVSDMADWFYSPNRVLGDKSPYALCKEGKEEDVKYQLIRMKYDLYS